MRDRLLYDLGSLLSRVVPAAFFVIVSLAFLAHFRQTGKWTSLLWMVTEGVAVLLFIFRRESLAVSRSPWDWLVGFGGSFVVLLVRPAAVAILPDIVGSGLQLAGGLFQLFAKIALGRSFGVVAANRGLVTSGPYRIVRHPIYLGYVVTHAGFLLANWSARNILVYVLAYFFQVSRILSEERLLKEDASYRGYCERVRYRLIPGLF